MEVNMGMEEIKMETKEDLNYKDYEYLKEKRLFMTVGLPLSGKSTLRKIVMDKNQGITLINADQLRYQIYGNRYHQNGEDMMWAIRKHFLEILMQNSNYVFIDETNTTIERRKSILNLAKKYKYKVFCFLIDTMKEVCINRANSKDDKYIIPVIERMSNQFKYPTIDEGFHKIIPIINNNYKLDMNIFNFDERVVTI
jgi:predicted kinase